MNYRNRTTIWIVLGVAIVMLWNNWKIYNGEEPLFGGAPQKVYSKKSQRDKKGANDVPGEEEQFAEQAAKAETIRITTDLVAADIDTNGGTLKRLELLKHKETSESEKNVVLFDTEAPRTYLAQTGLLGGNFPNHKSLFKAKDGTRSTEKDETVDLVLEAERNGVVLTKTLTFKRGDYTILVRHDIKNKTNEPIDPSLYLQMVRDGAKPEGESRFMSTFTGPAVYSQEEKFKKVDFDDIGKDSDLHIKKASDGWIAMVQHFFVSAIMLPENTEREIFTRKLDENLYAIGDIVSLGKIAPGETKTFTSRLFSGPQESRLLEKTAPGLELVRDYGWVTIIAKPIFWIMEQIQGLVGNWGWTIVILTILMKLLFFPLASASYRSMARMREVTPKMQSIRERYEDDKEAMNREIMELYKTEKINPLGGCLPMIIQIPVFLALYYVLLASVEIRNAPWIGWITDLAQADPYYILPLIMAVSMYFQQKMSPPPADPLQAKIMKFMPLIFSLMFFFFPAGLVLYWVVSNIFSIAQQWTINKMYESGKKKA